ncbi:HNH endonuclease [Paramecium bursaria Chlorella virus NYs1]|uniref:HNH nuclease domain-containing protein n=1 Tax=Paramecium bursaria Chlorella virus NYs1 TaxID=83442 RepID=M1I8T4_9PHYC|nr:HNH endonuclease [Paramecium bursaria Chlorella virus NYs1]AGE58681.1 hypothetical protein PBCVNYs1_312R [Paramecium bursaria Chlorella virus NYs1]
MFHKVPNTESVRGLTYEIFDPDWIIVSISKKGKRQILKPDKDKRVKLDGKLYTIYNIAKFTGLAPKSWPSDEREWEELEVTSDIFEYRYRTFLDSQVQKMDQYGILSYQEHTKKPNGYYYVSIAGESVKVHQMMGETRFVPKPDNMPSDWTVHHIDNDPSNNHCDNLVWASPGTQAKEQRSREQSSIRSCPVIGTALLDIALKDGTMIRKGEDTRRFESALEAADAIVGGDNSCISECINVKYKRKSHANFTWRTPSNDLDIDGEVFKIIDSGIHSNRFVSTFGRLKQAFHNGYTKITYAKDTLTDRERREKDSYPKLTIEGNKKFHRVVVELFFGKIPNTIKIDGRTHDLIVDHIDNDKTNARLDNLQLLTQQENMKKRHLKMYTTSVASSYNGEYEYHKTRIDAIEYVKSRGYPNATLEELNMYVNTPNKVYDRTWIRAHFEQ